MLQRLLFIAKIQVIVHVQIHNFSSSVKWRYKLSRPMQVTQAANHVGTEKRIYRHLDDISKRPHDFEKGRARDLVGSLICQISRIQRRDAAAY